MKYLLIDLRKSDEVYSQHFEHSEQYKVYNIPMNMIRFNSRMIIEHLEYVDEIYLVCGSARRAQFIKDKYFSEYRKIIVNKELQFSNLNFGENKISLNGKEMLFNVIGSNSFNLYSIMRVIQVMLGTLILVLGGYTYSQINKNKKLTKNMNKIPLIILLLFGMMALINGLTSTCTMSKILIDHLN